MKFRTSLLDENERYRGIVRVGGFRPKEYVLIENTAAKVWKGKEFLELDEITAENAGIRIGDCVEVERIEPEEAEKVLLEGKINCWLPFNLKKNLNSALIGRVVAENQKLAFKEKDLNVLLVKKTVPKGFVIIGKDTEIVLKEMI